MCRRSSSRGWPGLTTGVIALFGIGGAAVLKAMNLPAHTFLGPLMFSNSGNVGLPICLFAFGEPGLALGMTYFAVSATFHVSLGGPLFAGVVLVETVFAVALDLGGLGDRPGGRDRRHGTRVARADDRARR